MQMRPADIVSAALHENTNSIAYTYSEPLVHIEFLLDCMTLARKHGITNVLVTNGCINANAANEILSLTDAANIDLKCFSPDTYAKTLCNGSATGGGADNVFETVLEFIRLAKSKDVHVEITTLVVPGLNDTETELDACSDFIASLDDKTPWHLSAYRPEYRWNAPATNQDFLLRVKERAARKLRYVYTGNISAGDNNTNCSNCGSILVKRHGYMVNTKGLTPPAKDEGFFRCARCGEGTGIRC